MKTVALTVLIGVVTLTGCATMDDLKPGEAGEKVKVYDATYEDVYQSAKDALRALEYQIQREDPERGEVLGEKGDIMRCGAKYIAVYLERQESSRIKVEVQEKCNDSITSGLYNWQRYPEFVSKLDRRISERQALAKLKPPTAPAASAILASDVDTLPSATAKQKKNAYAVVIGIEQYRQKLPRADFAAHDAKIVGEYLTKVMGYPEENVVVRLNDKAAKTDLEKYLEEWLQGKVKANDSVFVYYSGHGAPNTKTGEPYLVPYDGDPAFIESTTYPLKRLYAAMDKLPAKEVVVMLDSCFSGAGGRSVIAKGMRPMMLSIENPVLASGKTMVLAASSGTQTSSTFEEKSHGLLTYYFLKGLQGDGDLNKDGKIDMAELYEYVRPNVERIARNQYNNEQTPQLLASPDLLRKGGGRLVELR
ncbi:MAG: caspase family protein [Nitrospiraceae bacterium]|nr:MAG: caspase family protein [Nitrospiraceae bacterium]